MTTNLVAAREGTTAREIGTKLLVKRLVTIINSSRRNARDGQVAPRIRREKNKPQF
jgi:hypothetical protein